MLIRAQHGRGFGQAAEATNLRNIMELPAQLPPVMTSLDYQPGFTPVAGQPGAFTVRMPPAGAGLIDWLERNKTAVLIGAGVLLLLVMMSPGRRRRR